MPTIRLRCLLASHPHCFCTAFFFRIFFFKFHVIMVESGKVLARGTVESLLKRFKGMARAETSSRGAKSKYVIGNTRITYIKLSEAEKYAKEGYVIKPITLDDLFIMQGVDIES